MTQKLITLVALTTLLITAPSMAQDLVQWRGADRSGIYDETGLLKEWPLEGPKLLWNFDGLDKGYSSVTIAGGKIFTTGETEGIGTLYALSMDGALLWKKEYGKEWNDAYPAARTTPVYYKGFLYMATGHGEALCLNAETGQKVWGVDMKAKFGTRIPKFGYVEAPVIFDDKIYFTPGGESVSIVALNPKTGETMMESKTTGEESSYCSPLLYHYKDKDYISTSLAGNVIGIDASDGSFLWKVPQINTYNIHANTPLYKDGHIFNLTGYKGGGVMLKLSDDGKSVTELWRNTTLDNQMGGAIWINDHIVGSGHESDRNWQCLDAKTGLVLYKTNAIGKGAVVYADGLYYCYSETGELGIMELNETGFVLKSKFRIQLGSEQHWAHPVIENGILYLRHGKSLMAYSLKK